MCKESDLQGVATDYARNRMCKEDSVHERLHERLCYMFSHFITYDIMFPVVNLLTLFESRGKTGSGKNGIEQRRFRLWDF